MTQIITPIISTAAGIAMTYGAGAANTAIGAGLGCSLGKRIKRIDAEIEKYKALEQLASAALLQRDEKPEESGEILIDENPRSYKTLQPSDPYSPQTQLDQTVDKIMMVQADHVDRIKATWQLQQLRHASRIDRANQASAYAQLATGGAQIAVATASIGQATSAVMNVVIGFSFLSSAFYLVASIYGFVTALNQLSENRKKQEAVQAAIDSINALAPSNQNIESLKSFEKASLEHTLKQLKAEEALFVQQRNTQAINIVAALLGIAAMCLFTAGTSGIGPTIYYALLIGSILLPLIAAGYTQYSMNETTYMKKLLDLLNKTPVLPPLPHEHNPQDVADLQMVLLPILRLGIVDNDTRKELNELVNELNDKLETLDENGREQRVKKLKDLFDHLAKVQTALVQEDLASRLRIAGMKVGDLEPPPVRSEPSRTQRAIAFLKEMVTGFASSDTLACLVSPFAGVSPQSLRP